MGKAENPTFCVRRMTCIRFHILSVSPPSRQSLPLSGLRKSRPKGMRGRQCFLLTCFTCLQHKWHHIGSVKETAHVVTLSSSPTSSPPSSSLPSLCPSLLLSFPPFSLSVPIFIVFLLPFPFLVWNKLTRGEEKTTYHNISHRERVRKD